MLDLFSIFSKGGIVLWCFQSTADMLAPSVNALIRTVILQVRVFPPFRSSERIFFDRWPWTFISNWIISIFLQERTGNNSFDHNALTLQYKLDNEFELIFVVAYQKILQLSYIDKFLNDVHLEFRDKYKNNLQNKWLFQDVDFSSSFQRILRSSEEWGNFTFYTFVILQFSQTYRCRFDFFRKNSG